MVDPDHFHHPENHRVKPFKVLGNLYFIGDDNVCSHLLDTEDGLVVIDTGFPTGTACLLESIYSLGFDPHKVVAILHSHGHYDHFGGTDFLKKISGAKTYLGWKDAKMFRENPILSLCCEFPYLKSEPFAVDVEMHEGDVLKFGSTEILVQETPGHTEGTVTFYFNVEDGGNTYRCGLFGGAGRNTMRKAFYETYGVCGYRKTFLDSLYRIRDEKVDCALGTHLWQFFYVDKIQKVLSGEDPMAFVNPGDWRAFMDITEKALHEVTDDPKEKVEGDI